MKNKTRHKRVIQFIEYCVSGGVYFWVGYLILDYLYYWSHWSLWWATIVSNFIGWAVNFSLQRYWAFNNRSLKTHQTQVTIRYMVITFTDFILNYFILYGLKQAGITPAIGQFISAGFFTVWNYLWYRFWVFPETFKAKKVHTLRLAHRPHGRAAFRKA
jgi:putative flippase GtrA